MKLTGHEEAGRKTMLIKDWKDLLPAGARG